MPSLLEAINNQRNKLKAGNNSRPERLQSGRNLVRVLPTNDPENPECWQLFGQHFIKGTDGQLKAVYFCTQTTFDEDCEICSKIAQGAAMTSDEEILHALKESRSSRRVVVNALYLKGGKHDNPETNPVVLEIPPSVLDGMLAVAQAYMEEDVNVFDLNEGINFIVEKSGSGMNTEYTVTPSPKSSKIDPAVMGKIKDLGEWARQESEAEKSKAITSVSVISGLGVSGSAPRLAAPSKPASRLADVEAVDADFVDIDSDASLADDIDSLLADLD